MLSLGTVPRRCGRWLVKRGYNNCTVPGLSIYPVRDILSHKTQSKKRRLALWSTYSRCNFINTACMVAKIGSVPRETLPNRPPKSIRKQRTKRYKTTCCWHFWSLREKKRATLFWQTSLNANCVDITIVLGQPPLPFPGNHDRTAVRSSLPKHRHPIPHPFRVLNRT